MINMDRFIELYDEQLFMKQGKNHVLSNGNASKTATHIAYKQEKKTINFEVKHRANKLRFGKKIYEFYNAPITKFWQDTILYLIFLMSLTYIVIVKTPETPSVPEVIVLVYAFTFGCDKVREILQTDSPRFSGKLKVFFSKIMNVMDLFFILTFVVALVFRLSPLENAAVVARLIYCVNSIYWYIRLLEFLLINKYVGVLIIIASKMLIDLFNFVVILLIVLMSFGVSRQAIKFPNEDFSWSSVKMIFLEPYFMLYGEVYAPDIDPGCNHSLPLDDQPGCMPGHWITPLTMTCFMIVANLLLLSILLASFNNTYLRISKQSAQVWKCQRYHIITSYESKPLLAPPFVIFSHIYMIFKYLIRLCRKSKIKYDRKLKSFLSDDMIQRLHAFEERCFHGYDHDVKQCEREKLDEKVNHTAKKVDNISARIDDIFFKENLTKLSLYKTELRLQKLEEMSYEISGHLSQILNCMKRETIDLNIDLHASDRTTTAKRHNRSLSESQTPIADDMTLDSTVRHESNVPQGSMVSLLEQKQQQQHPLSNTDTPSHSIRFQSQLSHALGQYTLHPPIYLQPVVKPPIHEYTSITDCIDTSEFDRPASPQLTHKCEKYNDDHCVAEPSRRAVSRHEIEILRLAEESQHVIISQMLNKITKTDSKQKALSEESQQAIAEVSEVYTCDEQNFDEVKTSRVSNSTEKLSPNIHRNTSQMWYVQSEADALCLDTNEDENDLII